MCSRTMCEANYKTVKGTCLDGAGLGFRAPLLLHSAPRSNAALWWGGGIKKEIKNIKKCAHS